MLTQLAGYYRFPTIHKDRIVFVAEDDLWQVAAEGGSAHRLTSNLGAISGPIFSPDGDWIAFAGQEGAATDIYVMPSSGGAARRLTYLGCRSCVANWHQGKVIFASNYGQLTMRRLWLYSVDVDTLEVKSLEYGPGMHISYGDPGLVLGRHTRAFSRWKRYRGGESGQIWVDAQGNNNFVRLSGLKGNLASPMWVGERIFYLSDQDGIGNIFSCRPDGQDVKQYTHHRDFYARNPHTDGASIVYQQGADIYRLDTQTATTVKLEIQYASPKTQVQGKFVTAAKYMEDYELSADASSLAVVSRGKVFAFANWEGPVSQYGLRQGVRYRLPQWSPDGNTLAMCSDENGEDRIELYDVSSKQRNKVLDNLNLGRPLSMKISPSGNKIVLVNHRNELIMVDLEAEKSITIDRNAFDVMSGYDWSPDSAWIAYAMNINMQQSIIRIYHVESGKIHDVTEPILLDTMPVFDPKGRYLYFLSTRIYNPVYDNMHFELSFPRGMRPYLLTLRKDLLSPFVARPKGFVAKTNGDNNDKKKQNGANNKVEGAEQNQENSVTIDFDGIEERVLPFPTAEGKYTGIVANGNRVFYSTYPVEGAIGRSWMERTPAAKSTIRAYDFDKLEEGVFISGISSFTISRDGSAMAYRKGNRLRIVDARRDFKQELSKEEQPSRKSGWINLNRIKVAVDPLREWQQMYAEAWRLQRDYFWIEDMSEVDWQKVYDRYFPLIERLGSRSEFSDLLWEMQGELGTSHAYELGGDYRPTPNYPIGFLGAKFNYDAEKDQYQIAHLPQADVWDNRTPPPLKRPGINVREGMLLLSIGGQKLGKNMPPHRALHNLAGEEVEIEVAEADGSEPRTITVKPIASENLLWYRDFVERNRKIVHDATGNKVGYLHIPDMGPHGYAEFHRAFLVEFNYDGLIIDVRYNGGGHVSPLLLEKLARKRLGCYRTRWMGQMPKPYDSPTGAMVAITNQSAGSDGDIFSHGFKMKKLGKLIGTRTWGGVIGIWPRNWLVDGTMTTQPEFSNWFFDVGYGVENYGTDPDIEVDIKPQDYGKGKDPQMERALEEIMRKLKENPPLRPDLDKDIPRLPLP